jgi:hypothetical protein
LEAVRVLEPIARTLAAQAHFSHGGRAIVVSFDHKEVAMDEESKALLAQCVAGIQEMMKAQQAMLQKMAGGEPAEPAEPTEEMAQKCGDEPKMSDVAAAQAAEAPAPTPVAATVAAPVTQASQQQPKAITLKYEDLQREVFEAKRMAQEERALRLKTEREAKAQKFVDQHSCATSLRIPKSQRQAAAEVHMALAELPLKFSDGQTPQQRFEQFVGGLADVSGAFTVQTADDGDPDAVKSGSAIAQIEASARRMFAQSKAPVAAGAADADAVARALQSDPKLYDQYRKEVSVKV